MCYWPGRDKEEQFPPCFGKRGKIRGLVVNIQQRSFKPPHTANIASTSK